MSNPFNLEHDIAVYCNEVALTDKEINSLLECPRSDSGTPAEGNRTAYVQSRLINLKLVTTFWASILEDDETFFTWMRTVAGDRVLDYLTEAGKLPSNVGGRG